MKDSVRFVLRLAVILGVGVPVGYYSARAVVQAQPKPKPPEPQTAGGAKPAERVPVNPDARQEYVDAARQFAKAVTKDDPTRFAEVFERAYLLAEGEGRKRALAARAVGRPSPLPAGLTTEEQLRRHEAAQGSADSVLRDLTYNTNYQKLLDAEGVPGIAGMRAMPRIAGGVFARPGEFPDCVAVGNAAGWCCTGVLVAPRVVVTAGHCKDECATRVYFALNVNDPTRGQVIPVEKAVPADGYEKVSDDLIKNDLTVLILARPAPDGVKPRKIASVEHIGAASWCRLVGFGRVDPFGTYGYGVQRMADVAIAARTCDANAAGRFGCFLAHELVAGGAGRDSCRGDSGGPLYIPVQGDWLLAATTSRATKEWRHNGRPCGEGGNYVRVDKYKDWIARVAQQENAGPLP